MGLKVFISADIEGVAGVVSPLQTTPGASEYEMGRRLMTLEVNAAIEGALDAGADQIVVCDGHMNRQNLIPDLLHESARLVRGVRSGLQQMQGLDSSFDAVFVTGQHAAAGTQNAVLDHTWVGVSVYNLRIGGRVLNETCLNSVIADSHGVPTVLVTGDEATIAQTKEYLSDIEGVVVKRSYSRYRAESVHPKVAAAMIRRGAASALGRLSEFRPRPSPDELVMEIDFLRTDMADAAALVPGVERTSPRGVRYSAAPHLVFRMQELLLVRLKYDAA
ncbi:MAG: M55 family metallopeptidase [Trueperaceae bacterium]|nr:M55 family metallopeptidase [Trueperaceae bacterium]